MTREVVLAWADIQQEHCDNYTPCPPRNPSRHFFFFNDTATTEIYTLPLHDALPISTPLYSEQGGVVGATIVFQDVTRLLRFDELKNDLVATVAHEFRTPLTSLRMAIHILIEGTVGSLTERQADLLYAAREDCERLQGIVDDLLDLSRIQAGRGGGSLAPVFPESGVRPPLRAQT